MRILYIDLDSQRPDHLGCYGYHRNTSPNIDRIAKDAVRFDNYYVSDAPCLPSRTALFSGQFGIHNGVVNHGGTAAEMFQDGPSRGFKSRVGLNSWMSCLRAAGYHTATVSSFGERHSAFHWYAGFNDILNCGKSGNEPADEVSPLALDWLGKNGKKENWFLHVNFWDAHTPYRTPESWGNPFKDEPLPAWYSEKVRQKHWGEGGPHSAQEVCGFYGEHDWWFKQHYPQQPLTIHDMAQARRMFDGYDRGVRYSDEHVGRIFNALADQGVLDDTVIVISADHGENLGELNIYGDHQTADHICSRVPLLIRWPGLSKGTGNGPVARVDAGLHYHTDFAATLVEMVGGKVPGHWDAKSFAPALKAGKTEGRPYLVVSQGAWSCQRSVRWDDYICIRSYHDGYHGFPDVMLFNVKEDPHEQHDLAPSRPDLVTKALAMLDEWHTEMMRTADHASDPMQTVLLEGGPLHTRGCLPKYVEHLRATGRAGLAETLSGKYPKDLKGKEA